MNENTANPRVQIITTTSGDDVRPGDHIVWLRTWEKFDLTITSRREGIAHHRDESGDWSTERGMWLTDGKVKGSTITIRRPIQDLPTDDGKVIVTADGHKRIEAVIFGETYYAREAVLSNGCWYAAWRTATGERVSAAALPEKITPGSWKVDDQ